MEISLSGSSETRQISSASGFTLHAPGMHGMIKEMDTKETSTRGPGVKDDMHEAIMGSMQSNDVILFNQFEIEIKKDEYDGADTSKTRAAGITRTTDMGEPAMVLSTPKTRKNMMCAVLHTDENGENRWVFPEEHDDKAFNFMLPRQGAEPIPEKGSNVRGVITKGIRRLVKVFAWMADDLIELGALALIKKWETKNRPYGLNLIEPGNVEGLEMNWDKVAGKKSLLLLHGTFSTWQAAFDGLVKSEWMKRIHDFYEGRVFAFNHPSLHQFPADNIKEMLGRMPSGIDLNLDMLTHSRGGLVGRELIERLDQMDGNEWNIKVNKAIFVAGPHQGTILTDKGNWVKLIDTYTNLLTSLPDNVATIVLESLITVIKVIGGGTVAALPGLQAMQPKGDYIKRLNASSKVDTTYYTMGANYVPYDEKLLIRFGKKLLMKVLAKVFGEDSDMVVPTMGSFGPGTEAGGFPIPPNRQIKYAMDADLNHLNYFTDDIVNKQIFKWLNE
jgi:hypothetical protein